MYMVILYHTITKKDGENMLKKCNAKPRKKIYKYHDIRHIELWMSIRKTYKCIKPYGFYILNGANHLCREYVDSNYYDTIAFYEYEC